MNFIEKFIAWRNHKLNLRTFAKILYYVNDLGGQQFEISGRKKRGKTQVLNIFAQAIHSDKHFLARQNEEIDMLREKLQLSPKQLEKSDTVVTCNYVFYLDQDKKTQSNFCNFSDFGLPLPDDTGYTPVRYFPSNTWFFFDEIQGEANSHSKSLTERQTLGIQYSGHNEYGIVCDSQRLGDVPAIIKDVSDFFINIRTKPIIKRNRKGKIVKSTLKVTFYSEIADSLRRTDPKSIRKSNDILDRIAKNETLTFYGNIHEYYNAYALKYFWLESLESKGYHPIKLPNLDDLEAQIKNYCTLVKCVSSQKLREARSFQYQKNTGEGS